MFRHREGARVWCRTDGLWCIGQVSSFDRTAKTYTILLKGGKTCKKTDTFAADKLQRYKGGRYKEGQAIEFVNPKTLVWHRGEVRYPTSPKCDTYFVAPAHDPSNLIRVREVDIRA